MTTIEELKTDYDWKEAFEYSTFKPDEISEILFSEEGENDGESWVLICRLNNNNYAFLSAGCDYTGWDCQAGGESYMRESFDDLLRWDLTSRDRRRIGMTLDDLDK